MKKKLLIIISLICIVAMLCTMAINLLNKGAKRVEAKMFELYSTGATSAVRYRKIAGIVEIRGAVKPKSAITGTDTTHTIFTLPEGYRPDNVIRVLCQGSYWYHWLLMIKANGEVSFSRYSDGNSFLEAPATAWLPFQVTFIADQ